MFDTSALLFSIHNFGIHRHSSPVDRVVIVVFRTGPTGAVYLSSMRFYLDDVVYALRLL